MHHVLITGIGPVSALGVGQEELRQAVGAGRNVIKATGTDQADGPFLCGGISDFSAAPFLRSRKAYLDRTSELTMAAAALALTDAGLDPAQQPAGTAGLMMGTAYGNMATAALFYGDVLAKGPQAAKPLLFPHLYPNTAAALTAIEFNLDGPHAVAAGAWTSGAAVLLDAADWIAAGRGGLLLAGGADALHPLITQGLQAAGLLSPRAGDAGGSEGVYSFDHRANGVVIGEGAVLLALESAQQAAARGATVHGELAGGAMGPVSTAADAASVMFRALERAGCAPGDLGWVCAHGSGDPVMDEWEGCALAQLAARRSQPLCLWTPAPFCGETLAAGAVLRAAIAAMTMHDGQLPALPGGLALKPDFAGLAIASKPAAAPVLVNSCDPGGNFAALVVKPWTS